MYYTDDMHTYSKPALVCRGFSISTVLQQQVDVHSYPIRIECRHINTIKYQKYSPLTCAGCKSPTSAFSQIRSLAQKQGEPVPLEWSDPKIDWQIETGSWTNLAEIALQWTDSSQAIQVLFGLWRVVSTVQPTFLSSMFLLNKSFLNCNPHFHISVFFSIEPLQDCPTMSLGWWVGKPNTHPHAHLDALQLKSMNNADLRLYISDEGAGVTCRHPSLLPSVMWNKRPQSSMFCSQK